MFNSLIGIITVNRSHNMDMDVMTEYGLYKCVVIWQLVYLTVKLANHVI